MACTTAMKAAPRLCLEPMYYIESLPDILPNILPLENGKLSAVPGGLFASWTVLLPDLPLISTLQVRPRLHPVSNSTKARDWRRDWRNGIRAHDLTMRSQLVQEESLLYLCIFKFR